MVQFFRVVLFGGLGLGGLYGYSLFTSHMPQQGALVTTPDKVGCARLLRFGVMRLPLQGCTSVFNAGACRRIMARSCRPAPGHEGFAWVHAWHRRMRTQCGTM